MEGFANRTGMLLVFRPASDSGPDCMSSRHRWLGIDSMIGLSASYGHGFILQVYFNRVIAELKL